MTSGEIDVQGIVAATGCPLSSVRQRAAREGWRYREIPSLGRYPRRLYRVDALPDDVLRAILGDPAAAQRDRRREGPPPVLVARGVRLLRAAGVRPRDLAREYGWRGETARRACRGELVGTHGQAREAAMRLARIGREGRIPESLRRSEPEPSPPAMSTRIPKGHPSRYALLKRPRLPDWVREEMSA